MCHMGLLLNIYNCFALFFPRLAENTFISPVQRPVSEQMDSESSHIESFISDKVGILFDDVMLNFNFKIPWSI